jgi:hypothetical protein
MSTCARRISTMPSIPMAETGSPRKNIHTVRESVKAKVLEVILNLED